MLQYPVYRLSMLHPLAYLKLVSVEKIFKIFIIFGVWTKHGVGQWPTPWCRPLPTLSPTSGQIFKNIKKTSLRVECASWHKIISLVVSCIPVIGVY